MGFAALVGGIVGSRVYFIVQNYDERQGRPARQPLLRLRAGLVRRRDRRRDRASCSGPGGAASSASPCSTSAAPALALGYAIGRCGCQLSGDGDYGKAWDGPWAMSYPDGTVPTDQTVHPTPIYETLAMGLGAWLLWQLRDRFRTGVLFAIYLVYAGTERFLVEFLRRNDDVAARPHRGPAGEPGDDGRRSRSGSTP